MSLPPPLSRLRMLAAALVLSLFTGCGDDTEPTGPDEEEDTTPRYALISQVNTSDDPQSYIIVTDKVDHTEALSLEQAIEVPGRALGFGIPKSRALYVSSSEGPTVTRYNLTNEGTLEKAGTVSFAGKGVATIGEYQHQFQFVSDTKAYYFDSRTSQAIIWNPEDMTVTGTISLGGISVEGALQSFATHPIRRTNQVIMPLAWRPSSSVGVTKQAGVVVVDTSNDTATFVKDERCGYVRDGVEGPDGMIYLATEAYGSAVYRVAGGDTPKPCLLRFNPQTLTFDETFYKDLGELTSGNTAGSLLQGPNGTAYLRVFDESLFTIQQNTHPRVVASATAWKWWELKLDTMSATPVDTLPASTGSTFLFSADNRILFTEFTNGSTATNLRELTDKSGKVTTSTSGLTFSFVQLR